MMRFRRKKLDPTITLGGRKRHLKFDLMALTLLRDRLNIVGPFKDFTDNLWSTPLPLSALRLILWAGLRHEDPNLTEKQVGSWIDLDNISEIDESLAPFMARTN